ncbi:MAG: aminotransferase class IV [Clostridia bacterium]|nr:aminotransferase class IV [Clostridia bacterium]
MKELGYYNGRIGELSEMTVPMNDRASWFGDGVYDAQLCRNYRIFALDEHVDRFFRSASMIEITPPFTKEELKDILRDLVKRMDTGDLMLYYQLTRGGGTRAHTFPETGKPNLWVTLVPKEVNEGKESVKLVTTEDKRFFYCNIKTLNLLPSVLASEKAKRAGAHECVFYRPGGRVTECSHCNVHILKGGVLYTAPTDELILPGIARAHLICMCGKLGIPVSETPFNLDELFAADEVIITSSSNLCMHAHEIDGRPVGMRAPETYESLRSALLDEFYAETEAVF